MLLSLLVWFSFEDFWKKLWHFRVLAANGGCFDGPGYLEKMTRKKNEKCWHHHFLTLYTIQMYFFEKYFQKLIKWGVNHLQGTFCWKVTTILGFGPILMTSARWRHYVTSLWRHNDVIRGIFGFFVILESLLVILPSLISNRSFPGIFRPAGHMPHPHVE